MNRFPLAMALLREDRSLIELIDSDYTFANQTLAEHYKIEGIETVREIYYWHSKQVAYLAERMDQIEEPNGTLLDNSLIVHTSELAFGEHFADNIPMAMIGPAGGAIQSGRHLACQGVTPVSHQRTDLANRMGVTPEAFGNAVTWHRGADMTEAYINGGIVFKSGPTTSGT